MSKHRQKLIGQHQSRQVAKLKKQAKRDGATFVGRYTVPHGKKTVMRQQMEAFNNQVAEANMLRMSKAKKAEIEPTDEDTGN